MDIKPIADPLPGESLLAVAPKLSPEPEVTWNRRLLLHSGRTLSEIALDNEQAERAGRLTLTGQKLSSGVISGLEAGLELDQPVDDPGGGGAVTDYVRVNPGLGLAASGEFVIVAQSLHVEVNALPVNAPVTVLEGGDLPGPADSGNRGEGAGRRLGPTLGELKALGRSLPRAGILLLQPVEVQPPGADDPQDPCAVDPAAVAFADLQRVDACRLLLFAWPTELLELPDAGDPPTADWRNRVAYALFEYERNMAPGELWPWQELGVPVGLLLLDAALEPLFLDRYSVVRGGGKARTRTPLVDKTRSPQVWQEGGRELWQAGSPLLWQARIQQFAEEITAALAARQSPAEIAARFRFTPPVGLLPPTLFDPTTRTFAFFPPSYTVGARPIPVEQIDLAIRESAGLAPTSLADDTPAQMELLVPVPQQWFEPRLLETEEVSPEFQEAIDAFIARRAEWLARRLVVRGAAAQLQKHLTGEPTVYPDPDPDALEPNEQVQQEPLDPPELVEAYGIRDGVVEEFEKLRGICFTQLDDPNNPVELNQLDAIGLVAYVESLDKRIRDANDIVDFGFLRVQTNIYRFRQRILGTDEALRLATSPVLAAIARGESAYATRQDLQEFLRVVREPVPNEPAGDVQPLAAEAAAGAGVNQPQGAPALNPTPANLSVAGSLSGAAGRVTSGTVRTPGLPGIELTRPGTAIGAGTVISGVSVTEATDETAFRFALSPNVAAAVKTSATDRVGLALDTGIVALAPPTQDDVIEQSPIVGNIYDFRTFAIAERLPPIPSGEARLAAIATKHDVIAAALDMAIRVADVVVPGFLDDPSRPENQKTLTLAEITPETLREILQQRHDPVPATSRTDADFFNSGIKATENAVALLRSLEGRIQVYRSVLTACRDTLAKIRAFAAAADLRLKAIGNGLGEARHDVAVGRALLAEEQERIARINERRAAILANHVPFLCFRRPRVALTVVATPARSIDAGFTETPVMSCLRTDVTTPAEIRRMVDLMRRAPLRWFVATGLGGEFDGLLDLLDDPRTLLAVLQSAKAAAVYRQLQVTPQFALPFLAVGSVSSPAPNVAAVVGADAAVLRLGQGLDRVFTAQGQAILQFQAQVAAVNLDDLRGLSWRSVRERARDIVTIGDLIDGNHGNSQVARRAADALDNLAHVATCLYAEFSAVPALQRLRWAELLSQYDAPVPLRNLANLPSWGQPDAQGEQQPDSRSRREMQSFVDWLFARINVAEAGAVGLINDLVRVCILLASHAPVNQIIAGSLHEAATVKPGGLVKIAVDPAVVRIGMPLAIYRSQEVVAHAVVADLIGGLASAEVIKTVGTAVQLDKGARVQFGAISSAALVRTR